MFDEYCGDAMFFEAMQIHAVCLDANIDDDEIRLLTYMHFKIKSNGNNPDYFERAPEQDCTAIEIMLGRTTPPEPAVQENGKHHVINALVFNHSSDISERIRKLDAAFRINFGIENRMQSELNNRLRLYRDEEFRKEMVALYNNVVVPRIDLYEISTIKRSFRQARERETFIQ